MARSSARFRLYLESVWRSLQVWRCEAKPQAVVQAGWRRDTDFGIRIAGEKLAGALFPFPLQFPWVACSSLKVSQLPLQLGEQLAMRWITRQIAQLVRVVLQVV